MALIKWLVIGIVAVLASSSIILYFTNYSVTTSTMNTVMFNERVSNELARVDASRVAKMNGFIAEFSELEATRAKIETIIERGSSE